LNTALGRHIQADLVFKSARLPLTKTFLNSASFIKISYLGRIGGDNVRDCGRRILNALMTTDVAITLNWKGKGVKNHSRH
jgi:hypothetical protein